MNHFRWIGADEFDAFWAVHWKSPQGQTWASGNTPLVTWMKERLRSRPFYVVTPWEQALQRRHFSQMWGQVMERDYPNAALRDLYWVHELAHWALVDFQPSESAKAWATKWDDNELMAAFISEVLVHGESPDWDMAALGHPAWARQFDGISAQHPLVPATWSLGAKQAWDRRLAVRNGSEAPRDESERWIATFGNANARWAQIWESAWQNVDVGLAVYDYSRRAGDEQGMRASLDAAGQVPAFPSIPYTKQAQDFAQES